MGLFNKIKNLFKRKDNNIEVFETKQPSDTNNTDIVLKSDFGNYTDIWEYIVPKENTQAQHILSVVTQEDWFDMDQIRDKIKNLFLIEYKHEKSLYPYIKTLVDIGLLETTSVGGKRKWKKKNLAIKTRSFKEHYEQIN